MNFHWHNIYVTGAQASCLRGGAVVPVATMDGVLLSIEVQKDFVDHGSGGSDG